MDVPPGPLLGQINLVVRDVPSSVAFYRRLGLDMQQANHPDWAPHHAAAVLPNGMRLELDSLTFARQWNPGWKGAARGGSSVVFFNVPAREDVDAIFSRLRDAGSPAQQAPEDAFWGARYAIVEDPDGNAVGIMSPIEPSRRRPPPPVRE